MNLTPTTYTDLGTGIQVTIPAKCAVSQVPGENTLLDGLVIIDENGNEWTWIQVPATAFSNATGENPSMDSIKTDLVNYATDYRVFGWDDVYYDGCGLTSNEYTNKYDTMLLSVYKNKGFYIGKYEVGIKEDTVRSFGTDYYTLHDTSEQTPIITSNKIPYNWVQCKQAEKLSEDLLFEEKKTSLMFGIQWDLVMKYLEVNGETKLGNTVDERKTALKSNSGSLGNYCDNTFDVSQGKYSTNGGESWTTIIGNYTKTANPTLLTTGATIRNEILNIYDIAGNVWELTLEKSPNETIYCSYRGGNFSDTSLNYPISRRNYYDIKESSFSNVGFRPTIY